MPSRISVVIPAAGRGKRAETTSNKLLVPLKGRPVLAWTLRALATWQAAEEFVVAAGTAELELVEMLCREHLSGRAWRVVPGGRSRSESVHRAVQATSPAAEIIVVHDAARPLVKVETLDTAARLASEHGGAVAAQRPADALRLVDETGLMNEVLDRDRIRAVQTPQAFRAELLRRAYEQAAAEGVSGQDDAEIVARFAGCSSVLFEAAQFNLKATYPEDFALLEKLLPGD